MLGLQVMDSCSDPGKTLTVDCVALWRIMTKTVIMTRVGGTDLGTPSHLQQYSIQMFLWRDQELQLFVCELDQHHRVDQPTLITSSIYIHITNTSAPQHWPTLLILCTSYMVVWLSGDVPLKRHNNLDNLLQETKTCFVCVVWMIPDKAAPSIACRSVVRGLGWVSGVQNIVIQFE